MIGHLAMTVPSQVKAPPAVLAGAQRTGSFVDHLATAAGKSSAPNTAANFRAKLQAQLASSVSGLPASATGAGLLPVPTLANLLPSPTLSPTNPLIAGTAATPSNGTNAPSVGNPLLFANRLNPGSALGSGTGAIGTLLAPAAANPSAAAKGLANQFAQNLPAAQAKAAGAVAGALGQSSTAGNTTAGTSGAQPSGGPATEPGNDASGSAQAAPAGSPTDPGTGANLPGAAELNARIVAGAASLTNHPDTALAQSANALLQPQDANAGVMPPPSPPVSGAAPDKAHGIAGIAADATNGATAGIAPADASTTLRNFASTSDHQAAPDTNTARDQGSDNSAPATTAPSDTGAAAAPNAVLANAPAAAAPNAAPTPTDMSLKPTLIALPVSEQVAVNIKQALKGGSDEIQIQLKPASLGAIDVKLNVNHDGRLTAVIAADRSDTLNLLKQDSGSLQQALRDAGFNADAGSLSFSLRSDAQAFAQNPTPQNAGTSAPADPLATDPVAGPAARAPRQHTGTLDIEV